MDLVEHLSLGQIHYFGGGVCWIQKCLARKKLNLDLVLVNLEVVELY